MHAIYRQQGDKLYKVRGNHAIEINLESYQYGVIGIIYYDKNKCPLDAPNSHAEIIWKSEFDKYYKEAMNKIKLLK